MFGRFTQYVAGAFSPIKRRAAPARPSATSPGGHRVLHGRITKNTTTASSSRSSGEPADVDDAEEDIVGASTAAGTETSVLAIHSVEKSISKLDIISEEDTAIQREDIQTLPAGVGVVAPVAPPKIVVMNAEERTRVGDDAVVRADQDETEPLMGGVNEAEGAKEEELEGEVSRLTVSDAERMDLDDISESDFYDAYSTDEEDEEIIRSEDRVVEYLRRQTVDTIRRKVEWRPEAEFLYDNLEHRGQVAILPPTWEIDFRGVPIPPGLFGRAEDETFEPLIYARSSQEYRATRALRSIINMQMKVRSLRQAGQTAKIANLVKKDLDGYFKWAAVDGGYDKLDYIPNVTCVVINSRTNQELIEGEIDSHFGDLGRKHREFLLVQHDEETGAAVYRREPPVIYGFAIINHVALLLTLNSADVVAKTMCMFEMDMSELNQGIWNGLSIGLVVCQARDEMVNYMEEFREKTPEPESDVDA